MRYLGLDIGTTTMTALVLDVTTGNVVAVKTAPNACDITSPSDRKQGRSEWDAAQIITCALDVVKQAVAEAGPMEGIGITGQMHGMLLIDPSGQPVGPFIGWQDRRGMEAMPGSEATYVAHLRQLAKELGAFERGCRPHPGYLGTSLFWLKQQNALPSGASATFLPDFAAAHLTGTHPATDATNAAGSGLFDTRDRCWRKDLLDRLGLHQGLLPDLVPSGTPIGGVTPTIAERTGLKPGTPVCAACGDNQASFAGSVGDYASSVLVNVGTGGQVSVYMPQAHPTDELEARPFMDGGFLLVGAGLVGGRSYAWLRDFFRGIGQAFFGATGDEDLYAVMNRLAGQIPPGSDGLICEPLFTGTRREPDRRGIWRNVGATNFTPGHLARALMEGLAEQFARLYGEMDTPNAGRRMQLIGAGNGIRKNALLRDILSARFSMPLKMPRHTEEAAFGAALMGAVSTGVFPDIKTAGTTIQYISGV